MRNPSLHAIFVVVTAAFRLVYVFIVMEIGTASFILM
jgi:hypothetical protein